MFPTFPEFPAGTSGRAAICSLSHYWAVLKHRYFRPCRSLLLGHLCYPPGISINTPVNHKSPTNKFVVAVNVPYSLGIYTCLLTAQRQQSSVPAGSTRLDPLSLFWRCSCIGVCPFSVEIWWLFHPQVNDIRFSLI